MTDLGYAEEHPNQDEAPVNDRAVRVLVWLLIGAILLILLVAVVAATKSLLTLIAGATTFLAMVSLAVAAILAVRVIRLEERVHALEARRQP